MLIDSPLALRNLFLNFFIQLPICRPPALHSAGTAVEQAAHSIRQHAVCGVGGDVVGGAGLFVVVGGWRAQGGRRRGWCRGEPRAHPG